MSLPSPNSKVVGAIVTSAAGVEDDLVKNFCTFEEGRFEENADELIAANRYQIGNLLVPVDGYGEFERWLAAVVHEYDGKRMKPGDLALDLARRLDDSHSYLYWARKNGVSVYCPPIHDGAIGDCLRERHRAGVTLDLDFVSENVELAKQLSSARFCYGCRHRRRNVQALHVECQRASWRIRQPSSHLHSYGI